MARLFADEDFPFPLVERLRQLGHDIITTYEAGCANLGISDADQLAFATSVGRTILTRNRRHFKSLHNRSAHHEGITSITDDHDLDGQASRINTAIAGFASLANEHIRVNRPGHAAP